MPVTNASYLERFLDDVTGGRLGSISEDRWLVSNYDSSKLPLLKPYLKIDDPAIVAELIQILTDVRERAVYEEISNISKSCSERVSMACIGYLTRMREDDEEIPRLIDILDHSHGSEFIRTAGLLGKIARTDDMPEVRRIGGQVHGSMRDAMKDVLKSIIERDPSLEKKKELILSDPVYPDEEAFDGFLDKSMEYLDVRYREKMAPKDSVKLAVYNNIISAIRKMRIRLYNEADNLEFYGDDKRDRFDELTELLAWANSDLSKKTIVRTDTGQSGLICPRCGSRRVFHDGFWMCPECGKGL